jgi:hypothetical protein
LTDQQLELVLRVAILCVIGAAWPFVKDWLGKRGYHYRSMKEQREIDGKK